MKNLFALFLILFYHVSFSQTLITDTLFGESGYVSALNVGNSEVMTILQQPDNKIIVGGHNYDFGCNCHYIDMIRTDACGMIDSTFGINGIVHYTFEQRNLGFNYKLQPDGKILVVGVQSDGNNGSQQYPFIARFNSNGTPDTTFGDHGSRKINSIGACEFLNVYLLDEGKLLCTGGPTNYSNVIMQFDSTGNVDPTFGNNGVVQHSIPAGINFFNSFFSMMRTDGKIISVAPAWMGGDFRQAVLSCFDTQGELDTTFGNQGFFIDYDFYIANGFKYAIQSDDKVIIAQQNTTETAMNIRRYNTNGSVDTTYGNGGTVSIPAPNSPSRIQFLTLLANDDVIIGYQENGDVPKYKKVDVNGLEVTDFTLNGGSSFQFPTNDDKGRVALTTSSGEMVIAGSQNSFSLTRFIANTSIPNITISGVTLNSNVGNLESTFQWFLNGNLIANETSSSIEISQNGMYTVEVTNAWGCNTSDQLEVINLGEESISSIKFSVFPNPAEQILTIQSKDNTLISIRIFDVSGKLIKSETSNATFTNIKVDEFTSGLYFLEIKSENQITQTKFIKK
ncbi:MAG TPA: T9SS type A sorting domain-containing protein [Flavobacteriales bacterium]|nr:T9SS type A sorting domain-containing protein [Flavobacteriales bacterium]